MVEERSVGCGPFVGLILVVAVTAVLAGLA